MPQKSDHLAVIIGTRAQLIKMAPVLRELEQRHCSFNLIFTGQHTVTMQDVLNDFEVKTKPFYLYEGQEITGLVKMLLWFPAALLRMWRWRKHLMLVNNGQPSTVVVHGDTLSTLLGAFAGKLCRCRVAHIESGLRSYNIFHPFPEELTRLLVFRLTDIAFCPGEWALNNMAGYRCNAINIEHNTLLDAVRFAQDRLSTVEHAGYGSYGVISIHRFENIFFEKRLEWIVSKLIDIAEQHNLIFVLHPATRSQLQKYDYYSRLQQHPNIRLADRMGYVKFLSLLAKANFVITDGGSNQEELSYLEKPTLLLRKATERKEGLNTNVVLCPYDEQIIEKFLSKLPVGAAATAEIKHSAFPSEHIVSALVD